MNTVTLIYLVALAVYLVLGFIYTYLMLLYTKRLQQYKKASRLLIVNKCNSLKKLHEYMLGKGIDVDVKLFDFENTNVDKINDNRDYYIKELNKAYDELRSHYGDLKDEKSKTYFADFDQAIAENDTSYRRTVMLHNKTAKTYNTYTNSLFFYFFTKLFNFQSKKDI
jgi:hypothetical protein